MSTRWARLEPRIVYFACDALFKQKPAEWIAEQITARFGESLHRTQVYRVVAEGLERGYMQLTPQRDQSLVDRLMDRFVLAPGRTDIDKTIQVVSTGFEATLDHVARAAADVAFKVIRDAHGVRPNAAVHVGFGAGQTTMLVARYVAERLRGVETPGVVLHAASSGFNVAEPATAPVAFFNFFHGIPNVSYVGFFAPAYVTEADWDRTQGMVGVRESFAAKKDLQILITSLATAEDEHGELNRFIDVNKEAGQEMKEALKKQQRVGDVMYRPFHSGGPITRGGGIRAVTLFELEELVQFAATPGKSVILVAGPCGGCQKSRHVALMPLLRERSLAVWSHLVTDDVTAMKCLQP